nr:Zgc:56382 [Danio rerio]
MEWRIILPVLCLIGILHLPGYVVSQTATPTPTTATTTTTTTTTTAPTTSTTTTTPTTSTTVTTTTTAPTSTATATTHSSGATTASTTSGATTASTASGATTASTASGATTASTASGATTASTASGATTASTASGATTASTASGVTTASTTGSQATTRPANVQSVNLIFKIEDQFQAYYSDLTDPRTISYVENIKAQFNAVYKKKYLNYFGMIIKKLSFGSVAADTDIEFDTSNSSAPNATDAKNTLVQAISRGDFNFTINSTSITALDGSSTTASPVTTQTTTVATTAVVLSNYNITFKMAGVFFSDLANLNSKAGSLLSLAVSGQLNYFYSNFRGFNGANVWRFRNGSIYVDALLVFIKNINAPNATELAKELGAAVRNQTIFLPIDPTTINITDFTGFSASKSPVLASMLTALWMTLASLLFSAVMR